MIRSSSAFCVEPGRIVALERQAAAVFQFQDPLGDVVEEVAVVGDDDHRAGILAQRLFEPLDRFGVEMVGRLVQQQQVGLFQQRHAQGHAPPLAAGKLAAPARRRAEAPGRRRRCPSCGPTPSRCRRRSVPASRPISSISLSKSSSGCRIGHAAGDFVEAVDQVLDRLHGREQVFADGFVEVQLRLLGDVADAHPLGQRGRAVEVLVEAGHDLQQGRFARPVLADHADLGAVEERQIDIAQHDLLAEGLADVVHLENELGSHRVYMWIFRVLASMILWRPEGPAIHPAPGIAWGSGHREELFFRPNGPTILLAPENGRPVGPFGCLAAATIPRRCLGLGELLGLRPVSRKTDLRKSFVRFHPHERATDLGTAGYQCDDRRHCATDRTTQQQPAGRAAAGDHSHRTGGARLLLTPPFSG